MAHTERDLRERRAIEDMLNAKMPASKIAAKIGRHRSTIYRETDRRRSMRRKLVRHPELCQAVVARFKQGPLSPGLALPNRLPVTGTPEQIGNRMIYEGAKLRVCRETISRYIYSKEGMDRELWGYLPEDRKARRPRRARNRQKPRFDRDVSILFRPDDVAHRRQFGHWEADLVLSKQRFGQSDVTSLVERFSRFTVLLRNPNRRTKPVMHCPSGDSTAICPEG